MAGWQDIWQKAQKDVHRTFERPAVYTSPGDGATLDLMIRVVRDVREEGDMAGFDFLPAQRLGEETHILVLTADLIPLAKGLFGLGPDEAYRVEATEPRFGLCTPCRVARLSVTDAAAVARPL